jgi:hypothetical protein
MNVDIPTANRVQGQKTKNVHMWKFQMSNFKYERNFIQDLFQSFYQKVRSTFK